MHAISFVFVIRRIVLITLLILPQRFWLVRGWRLTSRIGRPAWRLAGQAFLAVGAILMIFVLSDRIFHKFLPATASLWIAPVVQLWVFTSTFAFFCVKAIHVIEWIWSSLHRPGTNAEGTGADDPSRRLFFRYAASLVGALPFLAAVYGYARERLRFEIVRVDVPVSNLPDALNGLRIVQLSDIHIGDFMPRDEIRRAVDMANSLSPHLAVITGDLVTGQGDPLADCVSELSRLSAPLGVWGCNGNHEIYAGAEDTTEALFRTHGMTLLRRNAAQLCWNGEHINLIGIDYQRDVRLTGSVLATLDGVESLVREDMPNILLSHNPNVFYRAADLGIELTLAGHTHGGQINIEIVNHSWSPARFMTNFIAGLYQLPAAPKLSDTSGKHSSNRQAFLYVNRGLGTLGIPARLGADPEITLLTLRSRGSQNN